jgi:hypothetical protein
MVRHPTARRTPREAAPPDDVFVESVLEGSVWAKQNARILTITVSTVLVIVLGFLYYRNYRSRLRDVAETQLTQIRTTLLAGNAALAINDLDTFLSRFGSTPTASEARVLLARAYLENQEPQKAIDVISSQARDLQASLGVQSAMLLADAYESAVQEDRAVEVLLRVGSGAPYDYQRRLALENAARVRLEQGNAQAAVDLYDRILKDLPIESPERSLYQLRRAEAAAKLSAGPSS